MGEKILYRTLEEVQEAAVAIRGPIDVLVDLMNGQTITKKFDPTEDLKSVDHCYRRGYGVIAFINGDALYALPDYVCVQRILERNGFLEDNYMKVPFIWGDYPANSSDQKRWKALMEEAEGESCHETIAS